MKTLNFALEYLMIVPVRYWHMQSRQAESRAALVYNARQITSAHILEEWRSLGRIAVKEDDVFLCPRHGHIQMLQLLHTNQTIISEHLLPKDGPKQGLM